MSAPIHTDHPPSLKLNDELVLRRVLGGKEVTVSWPRRSQYGGASGSSACGLAALNCARVILGRESQGLRDVALLQDMMKRETLEEILEICLHWTSTTHLEVDSIFQTPLFKGALHHIGTEYRSPSESQFEQLLRDLPVDASSAIVITRTPEIIACLRINTSHGAVFAVFDSHPRPKHKEGAGLTFNTSLKATALYLAELFHFDPHLLHDSSMQWQAQLLSHFSAHAFRFREDAMNAQDRMDAVIRASLEVLELKAHVEDLKAEKNMVESENEHLYQDNSRLQSDLFNALEELRGFKERLQGEPSKTQQTRTTTNPKSSYYQQTRSQNGIAGRATGRESHDDDLDVAVHLQKQFDAENDSNVHVASQLQRKWDMEDAQLSNQFAMLKSSDPGTFDCGICLETQSELVVARVEPCNHGFCRDCIRGYIQSKLGEHRFPILCPVCTAGASRDNPGLLGNVLVQQVGLSEKEFETFVELEMAAFSILLHCRRCKRSVFVDRREHDDLNILGCPLPRCNHVWCKTCSREIEIGGPPHSCDGTSELNHLMNERGWKHCPGCRTPVAKSEGCNHMTCMAPGCNTHFCYVCGEQIVRSVLRTDIQRAVTGHYRRCQLFQGRAYE